MEHTNHSHQPTEKKSFFEKYQTFIAIVICGVLVAGGILAARALPQKGTVLDTAGGGDQQGLTMDQVEKQLVGVAGSIGLNKKDFAACVESNRKVPLVNDAVALAQRSGVQGTPTFFILKRTYNEDGSVKTERQAEVVGARDQDTFLKSIIDGAAPADQPAQPNADRIILSDADHYLGPKNAETIIVEYSDIECPFCKREKPIVDQILKQHPEYGFVYRHSPIVSLHPWAAYKAQASECATELGGEDAFWKFLDIVAK